MLPITKDGYQRLKEKLKSLKDEFARMPAIIAEARARGDLSENAEYHAARERQGMLQAHIAKIETDLTNMQIIDPATLPKDIITFGKTVKLRNTENGEEITYHIVGESEADISKNEITVTTPIAKGLLTRKQGDTVVIRVPAGEKKYTIIGISVNV
ncbi:MAG: transcription elongation factor GreA [Spirochaetota bacterium]